MSVFSNIVKRKNIDFALGGKEFRKKKLLHPIGEEIKFYYIFKNNLLTYVDKNCHRS